MLASAPISYVKWDMNRTITEPFSLGLPADRQGEFFHRYILGVYDLYARLTAAFPDILFESCAGGGGRFDPGMLAFAPQAWTSDDTDAVERLAIQWGTSLAYPLSSMACPCRGGPEPPDRPDHADRDARRGGVLRRLRLRARPDRRSTADDRRAIADQVAFYKANRELFQRGRFVRLRSPFEEGGNQTAWMVVAPDGSRAVVGYYQVLNRPVPGRRPAAPPRPRSGRGLPRHGLAGRRRPALPRQRGVRGGDELMGVGLSLGADRHEAAGWGDFRAWLFVLEAVEGRLGRRPPRFVVRPVTRFGTDRSTPHRSGRYSIDATVAHAARARRSPKSICMRLGEGP